MPSDARTWIESYAEILGVPAPSSDQIDTLLEIAGVAAHASERSAAPISCWLIAKSGVAASQALAKAQELAQSI